MPCERDPSQFFEAFLFPHIFRAFRMAIHPRKMVLAFGAVLIITLVGLAMDMAPTVVTDGHNVTELDAYVQGKGEYTRFVETHAELGRRIGVFMTLVRFGVARFEAIVRCLAGLNVIVVLDNLGQGLLSVEWVFREHPVYGLFFFTAVLAVFAVTGGAICRMAALQFAQNERPGLVEALRFSVARFRSLFCAPLTPVFIMACIGSFIAVVGLLGNIRYVGEIVLGLSMPLILMAGVLIMLVVLGTLGGMTLMFPTIAFENSECVLAVNNSFRYAFARPWRLALYNGIALVYGAVSYVVARFFVFGLLLACYRFLELGFLHRNLKLQTLWTEPRFSNLFELPADMGSPMVIVNGALWTETVAVWLVQISVLSVVGLLVAFVVSFCFTVNTIIYALMRKRVDDVDLTEVRSVYDEPDEEEEDE